MQLTLQRKLAILSDAAKYDASCASSGTVKRSSKETGGIGSTEGSGICHSYAPDGRCISLLKILLTNFCVYDCIYCVNRSSSNVERARFTVEEVVALTLNFYKRNYIEGLFLSSGIIRSPDYTMEELVRVARLLRETHKFGGYIHLKVIPNAAPELLAEAGRWADRLSTNIELPTDISLETLAPEKKPSDIRTAMAQIAAAREESRPDGKTTSGKTQADEARARRPVDADDRRRRQRERRHHPQPLGLALFRLRPQARLLFRLLADPRFIEPPAARAAAADARAPALPGRLADPLLRLRCARDRRGRRRRPPRSRDRSQARLGAEAPRIAFPSTSTAPTARCCCACPASASPASKKILSTRRHHRLRLADVARIAGTIDKLRPFIVAADWTPGAALDDTKLQGAAHAAAGAARACSDARSFACNPATISPSGAPPPARC